MNLTVPELERGTELLSQHLQQIQEDNPDLSDFHDAFEHYCANKFSLGSLATRHRVGGKGDLGIDFYSRFEHNYHIGQCKIPTLEWLEANTGGVRQFGGSALNDTDDALRYLLGKSDLKPNEAVQRLFGLIAEDRNREDFSLTFFVVVYGKLNNRARETFDNLKAEYLSKKVNIILKEIEDLVDEFMVGAAHPTGDIKIELRLDKGRVLRAHDYCYLLVNAADLFSAFKSFGWRLFDLNLRYEVRNSPINADIVRSLSRNKTRRQFHHFNNGLIVVCQSYAFLKDDAVIKLTSPQIVNGLQTVKSIYNAVVGKQAEFTDLERECLVQVKVINNSDAAFVSKIVQCTNNQNPMSSRSLRANDRLQKTLRTSFAMLEPKWFFQVKENEWRSLTQEAARFFEQVVGFKPIEFKIDPRKPSARVIDNQDAAKSWLSFTGFADWAGDRVTHFFSDDEVYEQAFGKQPHNDYWSRFAESVDFSEAQRNGLESVQASASQYLLAYSLWQFVNSFIPSPKRYREEGLDEGVRDRKITKASGSFTSSASDQDNFLATNRTYQTWRVMANMKELLVEVASQMLVRRYGVPTQEKCRSILSNFDLKDFLESGDLREVAVNAAIVTDFKSDEVVSRIFAMLRYATGQFWEEKQTLLLSTSRLRTLLLKREVAAEFKKIVFSIEARAGLEKGWKPEGVTFLKSLPKI